VGIKKRKKAFLVVPFRGPARRSVGGARHGAQRHLSGVLEAMDGSAVCAFSEGVGLPVMQVGAVLSRGSRVERRGWCSLDCLLCLLVFYTYTGDP
jgi:hypothetical protein